MISTKNPRLCYGLTMLEAAERYKDVVVLSADMMGSFQMAKFAETFPDRFFNVGVAEQNMAGIAAGMRHLWEDTLHQYLFLLCQHEGPVRCSAPISPIPAST